MGQQVFLRKYGAAATVDFHLFEVDGIDLRVDAVHAAGDTVVMKNEGAEASTTNGFTDEGTGYSLVLTATEMQAARVVVYAIDQTATKVWLDTAIVIETYGNASAQHAFDLDTASTAQTADHTAGIADIPTVSEFNARTLVAASYFDPAADAVATTTTLTNKTGFSLAATGLDAIGQAATGMVEIAKAVWDRVLTGGTHNIATSSGRRLRSIQDFGVYDMASVWVDEASGTSTGTTDGEDATVTNRSNDFDNAVTVAASVNLDRIHVQNANSITLTGALAGYTIWGGHYTLALGSQSIVNSSFHQGTISGIGTGTGTNFVDCIFGATTLAPTTLAYCGLGTGGTTFTLGSAGAYRLIRCYSDVAGAAAPVIDMNSLGAGTTLELRDWRGGVTLNNLTTNHVVTLDGIFGTITLNGADAVVEIRGIYKALTNNLTGSPTVTETGVEGDITSELATAQADLDIITGADGATLLSGTQASIDAIETDTGTTLEARFTGMTSLTEWLGAIAGKQSEDSTAQTEIRATGAASGAFDATTDSLEALRDNQGAGGQVQIVGHFARDPSNNFYFTASLIKGDGIATSGVTSPTIVGVFGNNSDADLVAGGSSITFDTGRIYGTFTLTTQPADNQPAVLVITVVHGGTTYTGHIHGVEVV